jgi:hypothetical protein
MFSWSGTGIRGSFNLYTASGYSLSSALSSSLPCMTIAWRACCIGWQRCPTVQFSGQYHHLRGSLGFCCRPLLSLGNAFMLFAWAGGRGLDAQSILLISRIGEHTSMPRGECLVFGTERGVWCYPLVHRENDRDDSCHHGRDLSTRLFLGSCQSCLTMYFLVP